jgi:hypothetical protein
MYCKRHEDTLKELKTETVYWTKVLHIKPAGFNALTECKDTDFPNC